MKPVSDQIVDGVELAIYGDCDENHKFGMTKGGSLRHLGSGKCVQPADEVLMTLVFVFLFVLCLHRYRAIFFRRSYIFTTICKFVKEL